MNLKMTSYWTNKHRAGYGPGLTVHVIETDNSIQN